MSALGNIGYLTKLLAAMRQDNTGTFVPPADGDLVTANIQPYDADLSAIAGITGTTGLLRKTGLNTWVLDAATYLTSITSSNVTTALGYTPVTNARTLTINGVTYDLTANRSWSIAAGVTSFNTRTGAITLLSSDISTALGYTPYSSANPAGYLSTETDPTVGTHIKAILTTDISNWNTAYGWGNHASIGYLTGITSGQVTTALGYTPENSANKGVANGYASLDGTGLVPSTQLPSYVDDVLEYVNTAAFPGTGTAGKIYVALDTNKIYRWSGTVYTEVSPTVGTIWGGITGTLANQTDLQSALDAKVPTARTITINGTTYDLSANRSWSITSMIYPGAGIAVSTGTAWGTSITDNSSNWNTAYSWGNHAVAGYLTASLASSTYLTISNAASGYQPLDGDLTSIAGLAGTSGFLKKTAANTWSLDTNTYLTSFTETDPTVGSHIKAITTTQISNWDTSYTDRLKWDGGSTGLVAATGRTSLGATTVGSNLFTLVDPTAITFIRINADNTVSTLDAATFRTAIGAGTSSTTGTVTSVSGTGTVSGLTLSGTVTSTGNLTLSGTLIVTPSNFSSQTANTFLAAPNGSAGVPAFRGIVASDIPTLNQSTTGSAGSVTNALTLKADTGVTEGTDLYTYNGSAAKTLNIVAGTNVTITKAAGQWTIAATDTGTVLNGTGFVRMTGTTPSYVTGTSSQFVKADGSVDSSVYLTGITSGQVTTALGYTPYNATNPSSYITLTALSSTATGLTYTNTTGVFSLTSGYAIPTTASQTNWDTAYTNRITSLTTTGSSGASTLSANTLNIPTYTLAGLGGQASSTNLTSLSGLTYVSGSFVKMTAAGTFTLDTSTYYLASNPNGYTTNVGTVTSIAALTLDTAGTDLSSSVATGTTTPVITLSIPTASATNRGALSAADWSTFNGKQAAINGTGFVKASGTTISYDNSTYVPTSGTGATGTWGISISGNAATVSSITSNTGLMTSRFTPTSLIDGLTSANFRTTVFGTATTAAAIATARWNTTPSVLSGIGAYSTLIGWGASDTQGFLAVDYNGANAKIGGGNSDSINWTAMLLHSSNYTSYSPSLTGTGASGTWGINVTGTSSNITAYSINQNLSTTSTVNFTDAYVSGWWRNYNSNGLYNATQGHHWYCDGQGWMNSAAGGTATTGGIRFRDNYASTVRGHIYYDNSNNIGFLTNAGNWAIRTDSGGASSLNAGISTGHGNSAAAFTPYHASFKAATNAVLNIGNTTGNRGIIGPFINSTKNGISDTASAPLFFNGESFNVFLNYDQKMWIEPVYGDMYLRGYIYQGSTNWSDLRMKQNLQQITDPLTKISALNGYTFEWKEDTGYRNAPYLVNKINDAGLIAQEVEAVFADIVETDTRRDQKALNYNGVIALHTEGIKELINQNIALAARVAELENRLL